MMTRTIATTASILIAAASVALAQGTVARPAEAGLTIGSDHMTFSAGVPAPGIATYEFISSEMTVDGKTVKGQPYSAEAVTETTQRLADGNKISRKSSASLYRDSEGRTRREQTLPSIGPWSTSGEPIRTVFISDPVAGTSYELNENEKIAHQLPGGMFSSGGMAIAAHKMGAEAAALGPVRTGGRHEVFIQRSTKAGVASNEQAAKTEDLGTQNIEGVPAKGTRSTITIPAGEIGNDRPIDIVTERWYSPELSLVVMTKHIDPRMGETTYKLTSVQRSEPSKTLFQVPPDYRMIEPGEKFMIHKMGEPNKDDL
jgi:hypothetical protein